jgi:ribosomal-protein-alanine N-acetyltransferase
MSVRRIEAQVNPDNVASNRLLRSVGFELEGTHRKRWVAKGVAYDTHFYGLLAEDWQRKQRLPRAMACEGLEAP